MDKNCDVRFDLVEMVMLVCMLSRFAKKSSLTALMRLHVPKMTSKYDTALDKSFCIPKAT